MNTLELALLAFEKFWAQELLEWKFDPKLEGELRDAMKTAARRAFVAGFFQGKRFQSMKRSKKQ